MKTLVGAVLASLMACGSAAAQSTEADISARLMGKPLQLRGFWMDDKLAFDADGKPVGTATEGTFTESAVDVKKVELVGNHLHIEGQRVAIIFDQNGVDSRLPMYKKGAFKKSPVSVLIDITGNGKPDFELAVNAIFATSLAEITPSLRPYWQPFAKVHFLHEGAISSAEPEYPKTATPTQKPRVLHSVVPVCGALARQQQFSGSTLINFVLDEHGVPTHFNVAKPLGFGLEERAIAAILQFQFAPAQRDGSPVATELSISSDFICY